METPIELDSDDPYQNHSFWMLGFWCENCRREMPFSSASAEQSGLWYHEMAMQARAEKWHIPSTDDKMWDGLTVWCAECAAKLGYAAPDIDAMPGTI